MNCTLMFPLLFKRELQAFTKVSFGYSSELSVGKTFNYTPHGFERKLQVLRVILKKIFESYFRLISSLMKSSAILESFQWNIKQDYSLHLGQRIFDAFPILCIASFKGREKCLCKIEEKSLCKIEVFIEVFYCLSDFIVVADNF